MPKNNDNSELPRFAQREAIAERLLLLRIAMGWEQTDAARIAGVSAPQWSNYERGRSGIPYYVAQRLDFREGFAIQWIYNGAESALSDDLRQKIAEARAKLASSES